MYSDPQSTTYQGRVNGFAKDSFELTDEVWLPAENAALLHIEKGMANGAPACFDCVRHTPPDSAQHAYALRLRNSCQYAVVSVR